MFHVSESFFEARGAGYFNPLSLTLAMTSPAPDLASDRWRDLPEAERVAKWMNMSGYFHELRHYHDLVGSVCGLHTILEGTEMVNRFYASLTGATEANPNSASEVRLAEARRIYEGYGEFFKVVMGDLPIEEDLEDQAGHPDFEFKSSTPEIKTFYPKVSIRLRNPTSARMESLLIPLGARALLEQIATELQVFIASVGADEDPTDPSDAEARVLRSHNIWSALVQGRFHPYYIVRVFASYARLSDDKGSLADPTEYSVFLPFAELSVLATVAMDISGYVMMPTNKFEFEHPGLVFSHLLAAWAEGDYGSDLVALADGVANATIQTSYTDFLKQYSLALETGYERILPKHLLSDGAHAEVVSQVRNVILEDHAAIIRAKSEDLSAWFDPVEYIKSLTRLPKPPLQSSSVHDPMPRGKEMGVTFLMWSFLLNYMRGVAEGTDVFLPDCIRDASVRRRYDFSGPGTPW